MNEEWKLTNSVWKPSEYNDDWCPILEKAQELTREYREERPALEVLPCHILVSDDNIDDHCLKFCEKELDMIEMVAEHIIDYDCFAPAQEFLTDVCERLRKLIADIRAIDGYAAEYGGE